MPQLQGGRRRTPWHQKIRYNITRRHISEDCNICLVILGLFNDAVNISEYITSNDGFSEYQIKQMWKIIVLAKIEVFCQYLPGETEEDHDICNECRCQG